MKQLSHLMTSAQVQLSEIQNSELFLKLCETSTHKYDSILLFETK